MSRGRRSGELFFGSIFRSGGENEISNLRVPDVPRRATAAPRNSKLPSPVFSVSSSCGCAARALKKDRTQHQRKW